MRVKTESMSANLAVVGIGLATPLGVGWRQSAAAVRAGISAHREIDWSPMPYDSRILATIAESVLPQAREHGPKPEIIEERLARLCALALVELDGALATTGIPLVLGLPDAVDGLQLRTDKLLQILDKWSPLHLDSSPELCIARGRSSGLMAVHRACQMLITGRHDMVLVGGCDSYRDLTIIEGLEDTGRLKTMENLDGFIPGEGAGFLLLTTMELAAREHMNVRCCISGSALGFEPGHLDSHEPYTGEGLAALWSALLHGNADPPISAVYSSMNGESYWSKELAVSCVRSREWLANDFVIYHPADCHGDMGAATGPALIGLAAYDIGLNDLEGTGLVYCSSDRGERAAVRVVAPHVLLK